MDDPLRLHTILELLAPQREVIYSGISMAKLLKIEFSDDCEWKHLPVNFFIILLYFVNKEFRNARKFLKAFMTETSMQNNEYYLTIDKLFAAMEQGLSDDALSKLFHADLLDCFSSTKKVFSYIKFPTCPECSECPFSKHCLTKENFINAKKIASHMCPIDQLKLKELLED